MSWSPDYCLPWGIILSVLLLNSSTHWRTETIREKGRLGSLGVGSISGALISNSCFTLKKSGLNCWEATSANVCNWSRVQWVIILTSKVDLISSQLCNFLPFPIPFSPGCHNDKAIPWDVEVWKCNWPKWLQCKSNVAFQCHGISNEGVFFHMILFSSCLRRVIWFWKLCFFFQWEGRS